MQQSISNTLSLAIATVGLISSVSNIAFAASPGNSWSDRFNPIVYDSGGDQLRLSDHMSVSKMQMD
jgi:hypothetical protein